MNLTIKTSVTIQNWTFSALKSLIYFDDGISLYTMVEFDNLYTA